MNHSMKHDKRDSTLTFAVIWDPTNGLETFSSAQLFDSPADVCVAGHDFDSQSDETDLGKSDEPFAVFSTRQLHFIDIRTSNMYKRCVINQEMDGDSLAPSTASIYSDDSWDFLSGDACDEFVSRTLPHPLEPPTQDLLYLTVPLRHADAGSSKPKNWYKKIPIQSNHNAGAVCFAERKSTSHGSSSSGDDALPPIYLQHCWRCQEQHDFPSHGGSKVTKEDTVDDEGFFEASSHADCDPHLPSRFSTTTTATSNFIDLIVSRPITPMGLDRHSEIVLRKSATLTSSKRSGDHFSGTSKLDKFPGGYLGPTSRLSNVFKSGWFKRPRNTEKWVLVVA